MIGNDSPRTLLPASIQRIRAIVPSRMSQVEGANPTRSARVGIRYSQYAVATIANSDKNPSIREGLSIGVFFRAGYKRKINNRLMPT